MGNSKVSKPAILDLLGISPRMRRHLAPRTPMLRMYCGKSDLIRPRVTMDDLVAREAAAKRCREAMDTYDCEMVTAF